MRQIFFKQWKWGASSVIIPILGFDKLLLIKKSLMLHGIFQFYGKVNNMEVPIWNWPSNLILKLVIFELIYTSLPLMEVGGYYYIHFADEEIETWSFGDLSKQMKMIPTPRLLKTFPLSCNCSHPVSMTDAFCFLALLTLWLCDSWLWSAVLYPIGFGQCLLLSPSKWQSYSHCPSP